MRSPDPTDPMKLGLVRQIRTEIARRVPGRYGGLEFDDMSVESLRDLLRLLRELRIERDRAVQRTRMMPWSAP